MSNDENAIHSNVNKTSRFEAILVCLVVVLVLMAICAGYIRNIELTNSWNGGTPVGLVWEKIDASNRDGRDFLNASASNSGHHAASLASWVYPLAYKLLGVDPDITQKIYIVITTLIFAFILHFFVKKLLGSYWVYSVSILSIIIAIQTRAINGDFARYWQANLDLGDIYSVSIPLLILSITFIICNRYVIAGCLLSLLACVYIHLSIMTTFIAFFMALTCVNKKNVLKLFFCILITCSVGAVWLKYVIGVFDTTANKIPLFEWLEWIRMMNYHFFPLDMKLFTVRHFESITPMLGLALLAFSNPLLQELSKDIRKMWFAGVAASLILSIVGVIISANPPSASFAMLSLHRASGITLLLLLPVAAWHIAILLKSGAILRSVMGLACIAPPLLGMSWGIPVIPALLLAISAYYDRDVMRPEWQRQLLLVVTMGTVCYVLALIALGYAGIRNIEILGHRYLAAAVCIIIVLSWLAARTSFLTTDPSHIFKTWCSKSSHFIQIIMFLAVFWFVIYAAFNNWKKHPTVPVDLARSYLDAQLWAKSATSPTAVFMPDPAEPPYGRAWSEYSRRASFGSAREWLHVPLVYRADEKGFREGVRRLSLLGIDPYKYKDAAFNSSVKDPMAEYQKMIADTRKAYYSMTPMQFNNLAIKEGIDFFIFSKSYTSALPALPVVYENKHFVIAAPSDKVPKL